MAWEYSRTLNIEPEEMNALGARGWELVAILPPDGFTRARFYWKRPLPAAAQASPQRSSGTPS